MRQEALLSVCVINIMVSINTHCIAQNSFFKQERLHITSDEPFIITVYFRWDKDDLDKTFLTNTQTLYLIDSIMHSKGIESIYSIHIVGHSSPEGAMDYNRRLSQRRADIVKRYILERYPGFSEDQIITDAQGSNWDEFRLMAEADPNLPFREQVLSILNDTAISDLTRQRKIVQLDDGRLYKNYILLYYYRYLRSSASFFIFYSPEVPMDVGYNLAGVIIANPEPDFELKAVATMIVEHQPKPITKYPIFLRTNLLYDLVGAINLGIEIPFGKQKRWSWIIDGAYSYWHFSRNLYALQTLEYGTEFKYWFGINRQKKEKSLNREKILKGWNTGVYGRYWQCYDVQSIDGYQGDDSWSAGLTVGYAFPIRKQLAFEASLGAGWFSTTEYRHYHRPMYDKDGKYHLMWQQTGNWAGITLTKVRFSLVWLIEYKQKGGKR